jgi:hypothetical protein
VCPMRACSSAQRGSSRWRPCVAPDLEEARQIESPMNALVVCGERTSKSQSWNGGDGGSAPGSEVHTVSPDLKM